MRTLTIPALCALLLVSSASVAAAQPPALGLAIQPEQESYPLARARDGGVVVLARFANYGDEPVFLAHPAACVPEDFGQGDTFMMEERRGRSEILLYVTKPDGEELVLRHNALRGFEPGNVFRLDIPPGGSCEARFGWLGPYFALGMWDDIREPIFDAPGVYRLRLVYRNHLGKAAAFGRGEDAFEKDAPWQGELQSNDTTVKID